VKTEHEPAILANRYVLETLLDRTSVGMVWLANDTVLDRHVTVTLVDPRVGGDDASRDRLFANTRALATATAGHLVRLLDAGVDHDVPYLVTERVVGDTLAEILERDGPLGAERAAAIVADVLDGLSEAHAVGVLHLDPSPANVVVDDDGRGRLRNVGIADAVRCASTGTDARGAGIPPDGDPLDVRSDVWCAGRLLVTALTGRGPFDAEHDGVERIRAPRSIRSVAARALAADPDERFPDARSMAAALRAASGTHPARAGTTVSGASRPAVFRTWFAVPLLVAVIVVAVVATGVWLGRFEIGGPVGIRLREEPSPSRSGAAQQLTVAAVWVVDPPPGDGQENDDKLPAAIDGDPATVWRSENYFDGSLNKDGIGLVLDLGGEATVTGFRLDTPAPGFSFSMLVGDDDRTLLQEARDAASYTAPDAERGLEPRTGRYVLIWITSVVPTTDGAHRAEISDIRIVGTP
jgi:serine/threonine protein kinase